MIPDFLCIPISFLNNLKVAHVLTYCALTLAFIAYRKTLKDKYSYWKLLMSSFNYELEAQRPWLSTAYPKNHKDKFFYSPYKIVYKLSFESSKEIARLGISVFNKIDHDFIRFIAIFNERIVTFNALLDYHRSIFASNSLLSERLFDRLLEFGLADQNISYEVFLNKLNVFAQIQDLDHSNLGLLSKQFYRFNLMLHSDIIGDNSNEYYLNFLFLKLKDKVEGMLKDYDKNIPWYLKRSGLLTLIISSGIFLLILENLFTQG